MTEAFQYDVAFSRNAGLISLEEQQRLKKATVAICGAGGVGGSHALTLARLGVGGFKIADADTFSVVNFNRQAGARMATVGHNKAKVIRDMILEINPEARVTHLESFLDADNIDGFLEGVDVVLDGIDFFELEARKLIYGRARTKGLWTLTAGPIGFSVAFLAFSPNGITFEDYFDLKPGMERADELAAFAAGVAPAGLHIQYMRSVKVDPAKRAGPSAGLACQLCSSVIALEAAMVILGRNPPAPAPHYQQYDPYRRAFRSGRLLMGNRGPIQLLKRRFLRQYFVPRLAAQKQLASSPKK